MAFRPREHVVYPILREKGLAMLYAFRGMGKTYLAHEIAAAALAAAPCSNGMRRRRAKC